MSGISGIFPTSPPDYRALSDQARGMVGYGKTITSILRNKVTAPAHAAFAEGMAALNGARAAALGPSMQVYQDAKQAADQVRTAVVQQGLDHYTEGVNAGKEIGAFTAPRKRRGAVAENPVPVVGEAVPGEVTTPAAGIMEPALRFGGAALPVPQTVVETGAPPPPVPATVQAAAPVLTATGGAGAVTSPSLCPPPGGGVFYAIGLPAPYVQCWPIRNDLGPFNLPTPANPPLFGVYATSVDQVWWVGYSVARKCFWTDPGDHNPAPPPGGAPDAAFVFSLNQAESNALVDYLAQHGFTPCAPLPVTTAPSGSSAPPPPPPPQCTPQTCPPGTHWDATLCKCVPDDGCCPKVECPTLEIPQSMIDCLCEIAQAVKDFKSGGIQPVSFASGAAGTQDGDYDTAEQWSGQTQQVPIVRELGDIKDEFVAAKFMVPPDQLPPPPTNGTPGATFNRLQSIITTGSIGGSSTDSATPIGLDWLANVLSLDWNTPQICDGIEQLRNSLEVFSLTALLQYLGVINSDGWIAPIADDYKLLKDKWSVGASAQAWVLRTTNNLIIGVVNALDSFFQVVARQAGGQLLGSVLESLVNLVTGPVQRWLGFDPEPLLQAVRYAHQAFAPRLLPSAADATSAYLRNQIPFELWRCWVTANNQLPGPAEKVMLSLQSRPQDLDLIRAYYRGLL